MRANMMSLQALSLSGTLIDDAAIEPLLANGNIKRLQLVGTSVTDKSIGKFAAFEELERLSVEESKAVSDAALAKLWDDLPNLIITPAAGGIPARKGQKLGFGGND